MYIAYNRDGKICNAIDEEISKSEDYFCPLCKCKLVFKRGRKIQSHFAHFKSSECSFTNYKKESKEHLNVKKILYQHFKNKYDKVFVEYIFKTDDSLQIADVYLANNNIAFEYQRSVIPFLDIKKRTLGYEKANIKLIWLIDINKFVKELNVNNNIVYIKYAPFVDNFLNYHKGCIFFYGFDREKNEIVFYQLWSHNLKKHSAVCKKRSCKLENFDIPISFPLFKNNYVTKLYANDIENYVYVQLKFDKTVKNKLLSKLYNERISLNNIPNCLGINVQEQLLFRTPLLMWQLEMYSLFKKNKTYSEIFNYISNYIEFNDSIYIKNKDKQHILEKVINWYYNILLKK